MARVMIVDDEPIYRDILCRSALRLGHEVESASDSAGALERGQRFAPDVLFVDWMLGSELSGLEVARLLAESVPGLIAVVISGDLSLELPSETGRPGRISLLPKPFGLDEFQAAIDQALERLSSERG